jgi:carbon storage regulator
MAAALTPARSTGSQAGSNSFPSVRLEIHCFTGIPLVATSGDAWLSPAITHGTGKKRHGGGCLAEQSRRWRNASDANDSRLSLQIHSRRLLCLALPQTIKEGVPIMLIFTRRIGQTLKIGSDIALTVLAIDRDEVRIRVDVAKTCFILTGGVGQSLNIGDDVAITVLVVRKREVRLGVEARADTPVYRLERGKRLGPYGDRASRCLV